MKTYNDNLNQSDSFVDWMLEGQTGIVVLRKKDPIK